VTGGKDKLFRQSGFGSDERWSDVMSVVILKGTD